MPVSIPLLEKKPAFLGLTAAEFDALVRRWGWPAYRAGQLRDWVYRKLVTDPSAMSNLAKIDRATLAEQFAFTTATIAADQISDDGTRKLLLTWPDGATAETVMIPDADRRTACVSSQVGCPVGCRFCASGLNGVKGNLSADQIVEQVVTFNKLFAHDALGTPPDATAQVAVAAGQRPRASAPDRTADADRITNIVFMGMGEPLANYANVMKAVRVLHDPQCLNLGARRITISTVGVPAKMRELAREDLPINLAISLHAPNEPLRKQLIPWAEHFALDDILDAARYYFDKSGREVTLEYILLHGVNDRPEHARELSQVCKTLRANVNLIRYNEVTGLPYKRPTGEDVVRFQEILRHNGVNAHVRKSRGRDIDAACGQLRRKRLEQEQRAALAATES
jgi:23S rRNA (adenine2503-C2)-methyltransferase